MKLDRRDLLKFFAAGSSILPIVGGAPILEAKAILMETPKIDLLGAPLPTNFDPHADWRLNWKLLDEITTYFLYCANFEYPLQPNRPLIEFVDDKVRRHVIMSGKNLPLSSCPACDSYLNSNLTIELPTVFWSLHGIVTPTPSGSPRNVQHL